MFIKNASMEKGLLDVSSAGGKVFAFIPFQKKRVQFVMVHRFVITESIEESVRYVSDHIFVSIRKENIGANCAMVLNYVNRHIAFQRQISTIMDIV